MEQRPRPQGGAGPLETARAHVLIEAFVRQHSQTLLTLAARLVGREDAEDVAQNAFVNLTVLITRMPHAEAVQLLESRDSLLRLMCKIASRRAYDRLRERWRNREQLTDGEQIEDVADEAPRQGHRSPEQELEDHLARLTRAYAWKQLVEVERHLGRIRITCPIPAEVRLDGRIVLTGPGSTELWASVRTHQVTASMQGHAPRSEQVTVAAGAQQAVALSPCETEKP